MAALAAIGLAYPGLVYIGRSALPPLAFVAIALGLIGLRLALARTALWRAWRLALWTAAGLVAGLAFLDQHLAAKAYPVALSLGAMAVFAASLYRPPSVIERFARLTEPDLPVEGQAYCRVVTVVWTVWLFLNAVVAAGLALAGEDRLWAVWTGGVAYGVMALLFGGEVLVRRFVRRRHAGAS
ncbi:hypothetical protein [Azospirillum doebereinerae]